jgi:hypothetical protein
MAAHDELFMVILANSQLEALAYGKKRRKYPWVRIIPLYRRAELYLLYGKRNVPFDVVPGTWVRPWHDEIWHHVTWSRIIPVRTFMTEPIIKEDPEPIPEADAVR